MVRGLLLDFYGTVVEDDDAIMAAIAGRVAAGAADAVGSSNSSTPGEPSSTRVTGAEVLGAWGDEFVAVAEGTPFRTLRDCAVRSLTTVMAAVGCPGDAAEFCAPQFAYWRSPPLLPGTREFLASLAVPVCIVSDADHDDLQAALTAHGLTFDAVVTSDRVGAYKPAAAMFAQALAALGLSSHEVIHIGDSLRADIAGAHAAGIASAWLNRRGLPAADGAPATHVIADLSQLSPHLA